MPLSMQILGVIALTLYIVFGYLIPDPPTPSDRGRYWRPIVAGIIIILILLFWFVLPLKIG